MLRKLLKYDLRALFRVWWIAAVVSLLMGLVGGFCWMLVDSEKPLPDAVETVANLLLFLVVLTFFAFTLLSTVLIFIRIFKNFFSDEGYLTFTLPVRRRDLLNSKVISGLILNAATYLVIFVSFLVMFSIAKYDYILDGLFWQDLSDFFREALDALGGYLWIYLIEIALVMLFNSAMDLLFLYCCITFGSTVAKKGKLIASIGIYYGANSIFSFLLTLLMTFGTPSISYWLAPLSDDQISPIVALLLLCVLLLLGTFCALLYALQYRMLERKLNLS